MPVRNDSGPRLPTRTPGQTPTATPAKLKNTAAAAPQPKPSQYESHFEGSVGPGDKQLGSFQKSYSADVNLPKSPLSQGATDALSGALSLVPKVGIGGQFEADAAVWKAEGGFGDPSGLVSGHGSVSVLEAQVKGSGEVGLEGGKLKARGDLDAKATLVDAEGEIRAGVGPIQAQVGGKAWVGAKAGLHGELEVDPLHGTAYARVGGDAFVGARAGVSGSVDLGPFGSAGGRVEAWAGVGVSARAEVGFEHGKLSARLDLGAALGIGMKWGLEFNIDFGKITEAVTNIIKSPGDTLKAVGDAVGGFFKGLFG